MLPLMYRRVRQHPRVLDIYAAQLHARGIMSPSLLEAMQVLLAHVPYEQTPFWQFIASLMQRRMAM